MFILLCNNIHSCCIDKQHNNTKNKTWNTKTWGCDDGIRWHDLINKKLERNRVLATTLGLNPFIFTNYDFFLPHQMFSVWNIEGPHHEVAMLNGLATLSKIITE